MLSLSVVPSKGELNNVVFTENFEGASLDSAKWIVLEDTNYTGYPAYGGSVSLADGTLVLSSDGPGFPFVYSVANPFPTSGDFEIEFTMQFTCIADYGCGVEISNAAPYLSGSWARNSIVDFWGEAVNDENAVIVGHLFGSEVYLINAPGFKPSTSEHIYKVTYINGTYSLYADGLFVAEKQSFERPNTISLGCPPLRGIPPSPETWARWSYWGWDTLKIDYVKVSSPSLFDFGSISATTILIVVAVVVFLAGVGAGYYVYSTKRKR